MFYKWWGVGLLALVGCGGHHLGDERDPTARVPGPDGKADAPWYAQPMWISLRGWVSYKDHQGSGPLANARVTIDGRRTAITDAQGYYVISKFFLQPVPGLSQGHHVIFASAPTYRTKVVRHTLGTLASPTSNDAACSPPCYQQNFHLKGQLLTGAFDNSIEAADKDVSLVADLDKDYVDDYVEDWLAERYAPIVHHGWGESNYPASVDWFLPYTRLMYYDDECDGWSGDLHATLRVAPTQAELTNYYWDDSCDSIERVYSAGTRSLHKQKTFYLADVGDEFRDGASVDHWVTYVHSFGNTSGGVTLQYWRFYSYNDWVNNHGGDWEGVQLQLDHELKPESVAFLGHTGIARLSPLDVSWAGEHFRAWSDEGGHASEPTPLYDLAYTPWGFVLRERPTTRQETWSGGRVVSFDGTDLGVGGGLRNMGEKRAPRNGQWFIQYSGLWGSPGVLFGTGGYWGPAFNETAARCIRPGLNTSDTDKCEGVPLYHTAWCHGMAPQLLDTSNECYADYASR
jgi:hypothetical protein